MRISEETMRIIKESNCVTTIQAAAILGITKQALSKSKVPRQQINGLWCYNVDDLSRYRK